MGYLDLPVYLVLRWAGLPSLRVLRAAAGAHAAGTIRGPHAKPRTEQTARRRTSCEHGEHALNWDNSDSMSWGSRGPPG